VGYIEKGVDFPTNPQLKLDAANPNRALGRSIISKRALISLPTMGVDFPTN
jgi:hypothetical protein